MQTLTDHAHSIIHHVEPGRAKDFCRVGKFGGSFGVDVFFLEKRHVLITERAEKILKQAEKIRKIAIDNGCKDVLDVLEERV